MQLCKHQKTTRRYRTPHPKNMLTSPRALWPWLGPSAEVPLYHISHPCVGQPRRPWNSSSGTSGRPEDKNQKCNAKTCPSTKLWSRWYIWRSFICHTKTLLWCWSGDTRSLLHKRSSPWVIVAPLGAFVRSRKWVLMMLCGVFSAEKAQCPSKKHMSKKQYHE